MIKKTLYYLLLFFSTSLFAQTKREIDSLKNVLETSHVDTVKINALNHLVYDHSDAPLKAIEYAQKMLEIAVKTPYKDKVAKAYNAMGTAYYYSGDYSAALKNYLSALKRMEELQNQSGIAAVAINVGNIYFAQNSFALAAKFYKEGLEIEEKRNNKTDIAEALNNLGNTFMEMGNTDSSLYCHFKALSLREELNDKIGMAYSYNNIANVYREKKQYESSVTYLLKALQTYDAMQDIKGVVTSQCNLALSFQQKAKIEKRPDLLDKALAYMEEAERNAQKIHFKEGLKEIYQNYSDIYKEKGNIGKAFDYYKKYIETKDSLSSDEINKSIVRMQALYETEAKDKKIEILNKDKKLQQIELDRRKSIIISGAVGLCLLVALIFFIFKNYREKQRTNLILAEKNEMIEARNRDIIDSINYAKRIQETILPPEKLVKKNIEHSFVLYKPKDIVSGDFYFVHEVNNKILFAVVDCTGHGVPGAFVSIVGHNALTRSVNEFGLTRPSEILENLNTLVENSFSSENEKGINDGMDIAFCSLDQHQLKLEYAGANNPLYIIRKGKLMEIKADKQPIGHFEYRKPFTNHEIDLEPYDAIYIFSDGYADQFGGGGNGKKFKQSRFKELLMSIQQETMVEQKRIINETFEQWKGNQDQLDDVCIIGLKV